MKFKALFLSIAALLFLSACPDSPTNSQDDNPYKQESIDWPSLADSPWPMWGHDPQWTFRSQFTGPVGGDTVHLYQNNTGVILEGANIIGSNDDIYLCSSYDTTFISQYNHETGNIIKLNSDSEIMWQTPVAYDKESFGYHAIVCTPLFDNMGNLIVVGYDWSISAINSNGDVYQRVSDIPPAIQFGLQIDKDGNLYMASYNGICSYDVNFNIRWSINVDNISHVGPFLPDGSQFYAATSDSILAVSIDGNILWTYPAGRSSSLGTVDNEGNLYFFCDYDSAVVSLNSNGEIRWRTPIYVDSTLLTRSYSNSAVGPEGNILFSIYSSILGNSYLVSVSPSGKINWTYMLENSIHWLIVDNAGKVYCDPGEKVICVNSDGSLIFETIIHNEGVTREVQMCINSKGELICTLIDSQFDGMIKIY